jgi:hypothetical protein
MQMTKEEQKCFVQRLRANYLRRVARDPRVEQRHVSRMALVARARRAEFLEKKKMCDRLAAVKL